MQLIWRALQRWLPRRWRQPPTIPEKLWVAVVHRYPFLHSLDTTDTQRLRLLSAHFLMEKEFFGAHGLVVSDAMALTVAAQACLPLIHIRPPSGRIGGHPLEALDWYDDFVGIVMQPGAAIARRQRTDASGVVHHFDEVLAGEAMDRGPVMLSWQEVSESAHTADSGSNVVIHEFAHKIDMRGMQAGDIPDGAPALGHRRQGVDHNGAPSRERWRHTMSAAYDRFREQLSMAERFGGAPPWLDGYAAKDPAEFFAVTCEAYFVSRGRFAAEFPDLLTLYDGFFRPVD